MPRYGQYNVPDVDNCVNFGVGQPSPELLNLKTIKRGMQFTIDNITDKNLLQYGDIPGYTSFRNDLYNYLKVINGTELTPENLFITNGISGALDFLCNIFRDKHNTDIYVQSPTYFLARNIFKHYNFNIIEFTNSNELFEKFIENDHTKLMYIIPFCNNPTGKNIEPNEISKIMGFSHQNNITVFSDEVYQLLSFSDTPEPCLAKTYECVISLGSFSKILAPSLRLGWLILNNSEFMKKLKNYPTFDSSGGLNPIISQIVHPLLLNHTGTSELENHLQYCRKFLHDNYVALYSMFIEKTNKLELDWSLEIPDGGYFVWIKMNPRIDAVKFLEFCKESNKKIIFHPGIKFSDDSKNYIRLSFSYYSKEDYQIGMIRLAEAYQQYNKYLDGGLTSVFVNGITGKLGSLIGDELQQKNIFFFSGKIDEADVIIDVTSPKGTEELINKLMDNPKPLVIGTTGNLPYDIIKTYSKKAPVIIASNFSYGIPLLTNILEKTKNDCWDVSIEETHHIHKKDAPSGTAINLAKAIGKDIDIKSKREGEVFGIHEVVLDNEYEQLKFLHTAKSRKIFSVGSIRFIKWIIKQRPGLYYNMDKSFEFSKYEANGNTFFITKNNKFKDNISNICKNINCDGFIYVNESNEDYDFYWEYYNADGNTVEMCGNGVRCVAKYVYETKNQIIDKSSLKFINNYNIENTVTIYDNNIVSTTMPQATNFKLLQSIRNCLIENINNHTIYECGYVEIGVPHIVIIMSDINNCDIVKIKNIIKKSTQEKDFNLNLVDEENNIRTHERGCGETKACGSGCCASAYLLKTFDENKDRQNIIFKTKGGEKLSIFINDKIILKGPVNKIFDGKF